MGVEAGAQLAKDNLNKITNKTTEGAKKAADLTAAAGNFVDVGAMDAVTGTVEAGEKLMAIILYGCARARPPLPPCRSPRRLAHGRTRARARRFSAALMRVLSCPPCCL